MSAPPKILPRFDFRATWASRSDVGTVRETNEDALLVAPELALFGVADGMGGLADGEVASRLALDTARAHLARKAAIRACEAYVKDPTLEHRRAVASELREAVELAHAALLDEQASRGKQMGSTLDSSAGS